MNPKACDESFYCGEHRKGAGHRKNSDTLLPDKLSDTIYR